MKKLLLAAALFSGTLLANADYSDYFSVETTKGTVEAGSTILCLNPGIVNEGYYSVYYDYDQSIRIRNLDEDTETFTCVYLWGSHPTKDEYLAHFEEKIPGTMQYVYGYAKVCSTQGYCYGHNHPDNLGVGQVKVSGESADAGFIFQLLNAPLDLVSEYRIIVYANSHPEDMFECKVLYAPSAEAASEFLGYDVSDDNGDTSFDDFTITPPNNSVLSELSSIEIYSNKYPINLNSDMSDTVIEVYSRLGELAAQIPFNNIEIVESSDNSNKAVLTLTKPVTTVGSYLIRIPEGLFSFGTSPKVYELPATMLVYQIKEGIDLRNLDITPAAGGVEELTGFTLNVKSLMPTWKTDMYYNKLHGTFTLPNGNVVDILPDDFVEVLADPDDFWSDIIGQHYEFNTVYTEYGNYVLNIPAEMFFLETDDDVKNPDWTVIWSIGTVGISGAFGESESFDVYDVCGMPVFKNGNSDQLNQLESGIYVINGKKVIIKK